MALEHFVSRFYKLSGFKMCSAHLRIEHVSVFVPDSLTLKRLLVVVVNLSRLASANMFGGPCKSAALVGKNAESVQKSLNQ